MKYLSATAVIAFVMFVWAFFSASIGWKSGGGVIPLLILMAIIGYIWNSMTSKPKDRSQKTDTPDSSSAPSTVTPTIPSSISSCPNTTCHNTYAAPTPSNHITSGGNITSWSVQIYCAFVSLLFLSGVFQLIKSQRYAMALVPGFIGILFQLPLLISLWAMKKEK